MTHEMYLSDLNLEDQIIVEMYRDCDEDGCTVRVHNWNLFIGGHVVQLPKELREKIYPMLDEYAAELDPFDS
jgi:NADH:ubiquinone oxidoreductase subunit D